MKTTGVKLAPPTERITDAIPSAAPDLSIAVERPNAEPITK